MPHRYQIETEQSWRPRFPVFTALRRALGAGYGAAEFRADLLAGLTVGIVALPLAMALAIASGAPPQYGLYTAIIAGGVIALCGGSDVAVSGPTAAFVVVLAPIAHKFGLGGLLIATMMAGAILLVMGVAGLGRLIQFIPYPVTTGFTAGIAVVIATLQVKDFLGLTVTVWPEHYIERVGALARALPTINPPDLIIGAVSLAILILWPKITRKAPAPLIATAVGALMAYAFHRFAPDLRVATIGSRFSYMLNGESHAGIPSVAPKLLSLADFKGADGQPIHLSLHLLRDLIGPATAIAMLGAIESLLCAVVADGMRGSKHNPDGELVGQGIGNLIAPWFGGIAATGAIARTAASVRAGAKSPLASLIHALFILAAVLALAPVLAWLPMASMAALLLMVAWNMSEARHFLHVLRVAPRSDVAVLLTCFSLTVLFDMALAVSVGVALAALLFMQRMAQISSGFVFETNHPRLAVPLPKNTLLYEIAGPLFFGAAEKAMSALQSAARNQSRLILDLSSVPAMDVTGLVALESILKKFHARGALVALVGARSQPAKVMAKSGLREQPGRLFFVADLDEAIRKIEEIDAARSETATPLPGGILASEGN